MNIEQINSILHFDHNNVPVVISVTQIKNKKAMLSQGNCMIQRIFCLQWRTI